MTTPPRRVSAEPQRSGGVAGGYGPCRHNPERDSGGPQHRAQGDHRTHALPRHARRALPGEGAGVL